MFFIYQVGTGKIARASNSQLTVTKPGWALGEKKPPADFTLARLADFRYTSLGVLTPEQFAKAKANQAATSKANQAAKPVANATA